MGDFSFFRDGGNALLEGIGRNPFREGYERHLQDEANERKLEQEKYNQQRQREYNSKLADAISKGEYDRAAYLSYQYGDEKTGNGIRDLSKNRSEIVGKGNTAYANIAGGLAQLPYEQRRAAIAASKDRLVAMGIPSAEIDAFDPTDANLKTLASLDYSMKDRESNAISQQNADTQRMDAETNRFKADNELTKPVVVDGALVDPRTGTPIYRAPKVESTPYGSNQYVTPGVENSGNPGAAAPQSAPLQAAPTGTYAPPAGAITSGYGPRKAPIAGASTNHKGVDIALPRGAPAPVVADGTVVAAAPNGGYGNQVRVRHADGTETTYSHLGSISVRPGDRIVKGQPVGLVGSTGTATGAHLHYEVYQGGQAVNPQQFAQRRETRPTMTPGHPKPSTANGGRSSGKKVHKGWLDNFGETANMYRSFDSSIRTFKKGYGGNMAGEVENLIQGVAGDRVGTPGQRDWWAAHRSNDNVERHKIFGAALTATEKAAWTSTTISPSMNDEQILTNLKRRRDIIAGVLRRQRRFLLAEGANPESLAALSEGI